MPRTAKHRGEPQLFKALAHPLRMKLLAALSDHEASPSELATELDEPLGNVAYHVRMLERLGCVELVRTTPRRGALEHHYKAIAQPEVAVGDWEQVPPALTNLSLDETGWNELCEQRRALYERALAIQAESAGRLEQAEGGAAVDAKLVLMLFDAGSQPR